MLFKRVLQPAASEPRSQAALAEHPATRLPRLAPSFEMSPGSAESGPRRANGVDWAELWLETTCAWGWEPPWGAGGRGRRLPRDTSRVTQRYLTWVFLFARPLAVLSSKSQKPPPPPLGWGQLPPLQVRGVKFAFGELKQTSTVFSRRQRKGCEAISEGGTAPSAGLLRQHGALEGRYLPGSRHGRCL